MNDKEQILKILEGRIDTMIALVTESSNLIYQAGYNEAIEAAAKEADKLWDHIGKGLSDRIRKLKK